MPDRTTRATLDHLANLINVALDDVDPHTAHYIQGAYGRVRLVRAQGSVEVSPSCTKAELEQWLRAFHAGIIVGKEAHERWLVSETDPDDTP